MKYFTNIALEIVFFTFLILSAIFEILFLLSADYLILSLYIVLVLVLIVSKGFLILYYFPKDNYFLLGFRVLIQTFSFFCIFCVVSTRLYQSQLDLKSVLTLLSLVKIAIFNENNIKFCLSLILAIIFPLGLEITGLMLRHFDNAKLFSILSKVDNMKSSRKHQSVPNN